MKFNSLVISSLVSISSLTLLSGCGNDDSEVVMDDQQFSVEKSWNTRLSSYAEAEDISLADATERLNIMDSTSEAMPMITDYMQSSMGGAYFGKQDNKFVLNVISNRVGEPTILDQNFIDEVYTKTGVPIHMLMNYSHNSEQMNTFLDDIANHLSIEKISNVNVSHNLETDKIMVTIYGDEDRGENYLKIKEKIIANQFNKKTEFVYLGEDNKFVVDAAKFNPYIGPIMGGAFLQHNDGTNNCTSGFAASLNNIKGVLSAGHCRTGGGVEKYVANTGESYPVGAPTNNQALYMDIDFFPVRTSKPLSAHFYNDNETLNGVPIDKIAGPGDYLLNDWVCHSGRSTGTAYNGIGFEGRNETCGRITQAVKNYAIFGCNGWTSTRQCEGRTYIEVSGKNGTNLKSIKGDSGGPWYKTTQNREIVALGIHSASSTSTTGEIYVDALFSPLYLAYDLGNLYIPTTKDYN